MEYLNFKDLKLSEDILKAINKIGYSSPTEVQSKVIPLILDEKDVYVKSRTGSGKTASFGIPICDKIDIELKEPQALILTPTRELCLQVKEDITNIGRYKRVWCTAVFGKQPVSSQAKELKQRVHIVVGTPGRALDLITRGYLDVSKIKYLIIDEADKMLNMGFIDQLSSIINELPAIRTTMLFSATLSEELLSISSKYMNSPSMVEINDVDNPIEIDEFWYETIEKDKSDLLKAIIYTKSPESCVIFCNTRERVDHVFKLLKDNSFSCNAIHGGMDQDLRLEVMNSFKMGEFHFLVATDVAARGIDIESLSHILNFDLPLEVESYVHRIGRTGRAGKTGTAITFVTPFEIRFLNEIENFIGHKLTKAVPPTEENIKLAKANYKEPEIKARVDKAAYFDKDIMKLYINAGKKKKIRTGDILGALTNIPGINNEDIGIINIQDNISYIDILSGKGNIVLKALQNMTIKGKKVRAEKANK
jgi:ATP-dependent RNA helicase DeaD